MEPAAEDSEAPLIPGAIQRLRAAMVSDLVPVSHRWRACSRARTGNYSPRAALAHAGNATIVTRTPSGAFGHIEIVVCWHAAEDRPNSWSRPFVSNEVQV